MNISKYCFILLFCSAVFLSCNTSQSENEIQIYAASSLSSVLNKFGKQFESQNNCKIKISQGSSGILARQIENGAPCDIFISAHKDWLNYISKKRNLGLKMPLVISKNTLVLASSSSGESDFEFTPSFFETNNLRLIIGNTSHVPLGAYSADVLSKFGFDDLDKSFIIKAKSASHARNLLEMGEGDFAILYKSDVVQSEKLKIVYSFTQDKYKAVEYVAIKSHKPLASQFLDFILSEKAEALWKESGFVSINN